MASDGTIKINTELDSSQAQAAMSKFSGIASKAMSGVKIAVGAASAAITAMAGYSIKVGSDFEAGMSQVSAVSGATGELACSVHRYRLMDSSWLLPSPQMLAVLHALGRHAKHNLTGLYMLQ